MVKGKAMARPAYGFDDSSMRPQDSNFSGAPEGRRSAE
jgi:hypothetical protein